MTDLAVHFKKLGHVLDDAMTWTAILESGYVENGYLYYDASVCSTPLMGADSGLVIKRHCKPHWKKVKIEMDHAETKIDNQKPTGGI